LTKPTAEMLLAPVPATDDYEDDLPEDDDEIEHQLEHSQPLAGKDVDGDVSMLSRQQHDEGFASPPPAEHDAAGDNTAMDIVPT
ncbi:hypothetical protein EC988_006686, partial [Linderina pennispora]